MMTYFMLFFNVLLFLLAYKFHTRRHQRILREAKTEAQDRLMYIRMLVEQVYIYKHKPEQLLTHLQREMSIRQMLNYHIIKDKYNVLDCPEEIKCHPYDKLLYALYKEGFTPRELCTIFGLNNLNTVYVKCHRMNKKLNLSKPKKLSEKLPAKAEFPQ